MNSDKGALVVEYLDDFTRLVRRAAARVVMALFWAVGFIAYGLIGAVEPWAVVVGVAPLIVGTLWITGLLAGATLAMTCAIKMGFAAGASMDTIVDAMSRIDTFSPTTLFGPSRKSRHHHSHH